MCKLAPVFILNNNKNHSRRPKKNMTNPKKCLSMFKTNKQKGF